MRAEGVEPSSQAWEAHIIADRRKRKIQGRSTFMSGSVFRGEIDFPPVRNSLLQPR